MKPELIKEVQIDDLPHGDLRHIAEAIGVEKAVELILKAPGVHVYIAGNALLPFCERWIRENHKKHDAKSMALMLGVSQQFVYNALKKCNGSCGKHNQMGIFEEQQ